MFKTNLKRKLSKSVSYLALVTMLVPSIMNGSQAFANEVETENKTVESTEQVEVEKQDEAKNPLVETVEVGDKTLDVMYLEDLATPTWTPDSSTGMYTIGKTQDGRVIQASAVGNNLSRATGNVQGDIIRIVIAGVLYEGVKITVDGKGALCIDQNLRAPFEPNVPYDNGSPWENAGAVSIITYGAYGPFNPNPTDEEILLTEIALRNWLTGNITPSQAVSNSHPYIADLIEKAKKGDIIDQSISFSDKSVEAKIEGNEQVSKNITVNGDTNNYVTIPIPQGITLTNVSTGQKSTNGSAKVYGGQTFKMSAPLSYNSKYNSGDLGSAFGKPAAIMFTPFDAGYQRLVQGTFDDPLPMGSISVNFFARLGNAEFQKLSEFSNLPMEGVKYKVEETGKEAYNKVTDAQGMLKFNDVLHDTVIRVTEIENPLGWVLDPTTYELKIVGGQTVSKKLVNELQMGKFKGMKQKTILDVTETKKQGTPVYKKVPLAGAEFNLVAETDIFLPDGKTLYIAKGTIVDTVVTDDKGYFESTKEFLIGEPNKYRLVEVNVPEGYRPPSEEQTVFSIPNGNNTEKLIVFDLGMIDNELQTGELNFLKRDTDGLFGLAGATLTVEMMSGLYAGTYFTFVSKAEGNNFTLPAGDFRVTEVKLPTGYMFDANTPQTQWVTIEDGKTIVLNWNNKKLQPKVGISTQAHTGDGKTQTFTWGQEATFYDDTNLTHENIPAGTKRAYETKLHANYSDGSTAVVWTSGIKDYTVTDKEMTERVIAEYDYRKDPKADEKTTYFFSEDGYNYDNEKPKKDTEHNPKGNDPKQQLTPIVKETPKTPATPKTPTKGSLPSTGETISKMVVVSGIMISSLVVGFVLQRRRIAE